MSPPSTESVTDALLAGMSSKAAALVEHDGIYSEWICEGIPHAVSVHRAHRGERLSEVSAQLLFNIHYVPQRKPRFIPKVEDCLKVPRGPASCRAADVRDDPRPTKDQMQRAVLKWIVDVHNQTLSPKLGCTPAQQWTSGLRDAPALRFLPQ
jgi:hypothetical protein